MKARAKRIDNGEVMYGVILRTPSGSLCFGWERVTPDDIEIIHKSVYPDTVEYHVNGEWLSEGEVAFFCPTGMVLKAKRKIASMTDEERQAYYDKLFENREGRDIQNEPNAFDVLSIWHKQTVEENTRLRAENARLMDEYDAMNEVISELQNERNQLNAKLGELEDELTHRIANEERMRDEVERLKGKDYLKSIATKFFYWWYNAPGRNTEQGFDKWYEEEYQKL